MKSCTYKSYISFCTSGGPRTHKMQLYSNKANNQLFMIIIHGQFYYVKPPFL